MFSGVAEKGQWHEMCESVLRIVTWKFIVWLFILLWNQIEIKLEYLALLSPLSLCGIFVILVCCMIFHSLSRFFLHDFSVAISTRYKLSPDEVLDEVLDEVSIRWSELSQV